MRYSAVLGNRFFGECCQRAAVYRGLAWGKAAWLAFDENGLPMNIVILDDYQDAVRKLQCASVLDAYSAKVYT
ncbi:hypothetical protein DVW31_16830, partial [Enterococcus faecium]